MHLALAPDKHHTVVSDHAAGHEWLGQLGGACGDRFTVFSASRTADIDGFFRLEATVGQRSSPADGLLYLHRHAAVRTDSRFAHRNRNLFELPYLQLMAFVERADGRP